MASLKEATAKKEEKLSALLEQAEGHPLMKQILAEKAAAILATRTEAVGKIEVLKKERDEAISKLLADRDAKDAKYKAAKAALDTAAGEFQTARAAVSSANYTFDTAISNQKSILLETADPAIDEAITFFRGKLDELREPGKISQRGRDTERNVFTMQVKTTIETNIQAVHDALTYCKAAVEELERMKLTPALDLQKIEGMKTALPKIDIYTECTGEKPMLESIGVPIVRPRFGGAASDEYEQTLLDRVHKKANDFLRR